MFALAGQSDKLKLTSVGLAFFCLLRKFEQFSSIVKKKLKLKKPFFAW